MTEYSNINTMKAELKALGFKQSFPAANFFRKGLNWTQSITVQVDKFVKFNDKLEDAEDAIFGYQVTIIDLPKTEHKLFKHPENALKYIQSILSNIQP